MATWGSYGGAWQYAVGANSNSNVHPKLAEAFGRDASAFQRSTYGSRLDPGLNRGFSDELTEAASPELEVPRVFSMKQSAQDGAFSGGAPPGGGNDFMGASRFGMAIGAAAAAPCMAPGSVNPCMDPHWVTVFGFPGRAAVVVRQQLETLCGPILDVIQEDGNFMHVRFQNVSSANQCLAHHGHAILGKLYIGCVQCTSTRLGASSGLAGETREELDLRRRESSVTPSVASFAGLPAGPGGPGSGGAAFGQNGGGCWLNGRGGPAGYGNQAPPQIRKGGIFCRVLDALFDI